MKNRTGRILGILILLIGYVQLHAQHAEAETDGELRSARHNLLAEALVLQLKADSCFRISRDKRILARETPDEALKKQLVEEIIQSDKEARFLQQKADQKFSAAGSFKESEKEQGTMADTNLVPAQRINDIQVYQYKTDPLYAERKDPPVRTDEFAILEKSPYDASNPIPQGLPEHPGLIYRVQLGAFSKAKDPDAFGGISPVTFLQLTGSTILKYYAGVFYSVNAVTGALTQIRAKGFPDAFIVAFFNGQLITTEKAREIEFERFKL